MKKFLLLAILLLCFIPVQAQLRPLPLLPSQAILNQIIYNTSGVPFTPLGVPDAVINHLHTFGSPFDNIVARLDPEQAVHYFATSGQLLESVIPLKDNEVMLLDPDFTTPGLKPRAGKVVGAVFQPSRGVMIVVAIFRNPAKPPVKLRFYTDATNYIQVDAVRNRFKDKDHNAMVEVLDEGAVIMNKFSCVTVGLEQVCWAQQATTTTTRAAVTRWEDDDCDDRWGDNECCGDDDDRWHDDCDDEPQPPVDPKNAVRAAFQRFKLIYNFQGRFMVGDTVPDLMGQGNRLQCRLQLKYASAFDNLSYCRPNVIFTGIKSYNATQPLGIFLVQERVSMVTYRASDGAYVGELPAGSYLILDATPTIRQPGSVGVLMLVNEATSNHYLIPVMMMQGFGRNPEIEKPRAGIKDGFVWGRGFGY